MHFNFFGGGFGGGDFFFLKLSKFFLKNHLIIFKTTKYLEDFQGRHTEKNLYEVLGVPKTATDNEIKKKYRALVKTMMYPEKGGDFEKVFFLY